MGETQNDEDAPPTEEEIKELWRRNRLNVLRQEDFHRGRTIHVVFHGFYRKPLMTPEYWNKPVPTTTRVHAVAFTLTRRHVPVESRHAGEPQWATVIEIRGNGVLVESTAREGLHRCVL